MEKYRKKYRIKSTRLQNWDYGWNAHYYVTVCTAKKIKYFGDIDVKDTDEINRTALSEIGEIAYKCWMEIPRHFPFVRLGEFVIMPNHIHGILILDGKKNVCVGGQNNMNPD